MMRIITVSREFGSGGREIGKRLADLLGYEYYDKEIVTAIAENKGMNENYVEKIMEGKALKSVHMHFRSSLSGGIAMGQARTDLLLEQKKVIEAIAGAEKNCVIVGRNADVLLNAYEPFKLFVCADMDTKIQRCMERAGKDEKLSPKEMERKIRAIDKGRAQAREIVTNIPWGDKKAYHLTVNTAGWNIKELVPIIAGFADCWFRRKENDSVIRSL